MLFLVLVALGLFQIALGFVYGVIWSGSRWIYYLTHYGGMQRETVERIGREALRRRP